MLADGFYKGHGDGRIFQVTGGTRVVVAVSEQDFLQKFGDAALGRRKEMYLADIFANTSDGGAQVTAAPVASPSGPAMSISSAGGGFLPTSSDGKPNLLLIGGLAAAVWFFFLR